MGAKPGVERGMEGERERGEGRRSRGANQPPLATEVSSNRSPPILNPPGEYSPFSERKDRQAGVLSHCHFGTFFLILLNSVAPARHNSEIVSS